jgi:hypothetical protein
MQINSTTTKHIYNKKCTRFVVIVLRVPYLAMV